MDVAWRLQLKNWSCLYVPEAKAYHFRGTGLKQEPSLKEILKGHRHRSAQVEFYSYRNHLWLLLKNSYWSNILLHLGWILFYQLSKELYLLIFKPRVLFRASGSFWRSYQEMLKKRKMIIKQAVQSPKEIRIWFKSARFYQ
jgi:GT2 family glycosyltransferase